MFLTRRGVTLAERVKLAGKVAGDGDARTEGGRTPTHPEDSADSSRTPPDDAPRDGMVKQGFRAPEGGKPPSERGGNACGMEW